MGTIQGVVTRESTMRVNLRGEFDGTYFAVKLEGKMGIGEIPNEILVVTGKSGYFRKGDKVTLQGKIFKNYIKKWERPSYYISVHTIFIMNHFKLAMSNTSTEFARIILKRETISSRY